MVEDMLHQGEQFCEAIIDGNMTEIKKLVMNNINDTKVCQGFLHSAVTQPRKEIVEYLLHKGISENIEDSCIGSGFIPIHFACVQGHYKIVDLLLQKGSLPLINKQTDHGCTPLHFGSMHGRDEVVAVLLKHGANLDIKCKNRETALMMARRLGKDGIAEMIQKELNRRISVRRIGFRLLRAARGICPSIDERIPIEIRRHILSFLDDEGMLTNQQINIIECGFDINTLLHHPEKLHFLGSA